MITLNERMKKFCSNIQTKDLTNSETKRRTLNTKLKRKTTNDPMKRSMRNAKCWRAQTITLNFSIIIIVWERYYFMCAFFLSLGSFDSYMCTNGWKENYRACYNVDERRSDAKRIRKMNHMNIYSFFVRYALRVHLLDHFWCNETLNCAYAGLGFTT